MSASAASLTVHHGRVFEANSGQALRTVVASKEELDREVLGALEKADAARKQMAQNAATMQRLETEVAQHRSKAVEHRTKAVELRSGAEQRQANATAILQEATKENELATAARQKAEDARKAAQAAGEKEDAAKTRKIGAQTKEASSQATMDDNEKKAQKVVLAKVLGVSANLVNIEKLPAGSFVFEMHQRQLVVQEAGVEGLISLIKGNPSQFKTLDFTLCKATRANLQGIPRLIAAISDEIAVQTVILSCPLEESEIQTLAEKVTRAGSVLKVTLNDASTRDKFDRALKAVHVV